MQELMEFDNISFEIIGGIHLSWDSDDIIIIIKVIPSSGSHKPRYQITPITEHGLLSFFCSKLDSLEHCYPNGPCCTFPDFLKDFYLSLCCVDPTDPMPEYFKMAAVINLIEGSLL